MEASSCNGSVVSGAGGSSGQSSLGSAVESSSTTLHPTHSSEQQSIIQGRSVLHQQQQPYPGQQQQQHPSSSSSTVSNQAERCNVGRSSDDRSGRMPRSDRQSGGGHHGPPHQTLTRGRDPTTTTTAAHVVGSARNFETGSGKAAKNIKVEPNEGSGSNPRDSIHPSKIGGGHGSAAIAINVAPNLLRSGSGIGNCISSMSMMGDNSGAHSQQQQQQLAASGVLDVLGNGLAVPSLVSAGFDAGLGVGGGSCSDGLIDPLTGLGRVGFDPTLHHSATQWFTNQSPFVPRGGSSSSGGGGGGQDLYHRLSIACPESSALQGEACSLQGYSSSASGPCAWYGPQPPPSTGDMSNGCHVNYGALSPVLDVFDAAAVSRIRSPSSSSSANQLPQHLARQSCQLSSSFRSGAYYPPTGSYAAYVSENDCASKF